MPSSGFSLLNVGKNSGHADVAIRKLRQVETFRRQYDKYNTRLSDTLTTAKPLYDDGTIKTPSLQQVEDHFDIVDDRVQSKVQTILGSQALDDCVGGVISQMNDYITNSQADFSLDFLDLDGFTFPDIDLPSVDVPFPDFLKYASELVYAMRIVAEKMAQAVDSIIRSIPCMTEGAEYQLVAEVVTDTFFATDGTGIVIEGDFDLQDAENILFQESVFDQVITSKFDDAGFPSDISSITKDIAVKKLDVNNTLKQAAIDNSGKFIKSFAESSIPKKFF